MIYTCRWDERLVESRKQHIHIWPQFQALFNIQANKYHYRLLHSLKNSMIYEHTCNRPIHDNCIFYVWNTDDNFNIIITLLLKNGNIFSIKKQDANVLKNRIEPRILVFFTLTKIRLQIQVEMKPLSYMWSSLHRPIFRYYLTI